MEQYFAAKVCKSGDRVHSAEIVPWKEAIWRRCVLANRDGSHSDDSGNMGNRRGRMGFEY